MLKLISQQEVILINEIITGNYIDQERKDKIKGIFSSFFYYETKEEQITSIVTSIVKNHYFIDGNKRTAVAVYLLLSKFNNLDFISNNNEIIATFISIPTLNYEIENISKILFPKKV